MIKKLLFAVILLTALTACSLTQNVPNTATPTQATIIGNINTSTPTPTATQTATLRPSATATQQVVVVVTNLPPCVPRTDWSYQYSVARGDTLYSIGQKVGLSAQQIATGNCIANINTIVVGQILKLPVPVPTNTPTTLTPTATATQEDISSPAGYIDLSEMLSADAGNFLLLRGSVISVKWSVPPQPFSSATFFLADQGYPDTPNTSATIIGTDDTPENGFQINWLVPAGLEKKIYAEGKRANGAIIQSYPVSVYSAPPQGQGCSITPANSAVPAYYGSSTDTGFWADVALGQAVEVLGRSVGGWYAFDSGSGGTPTLARIRWLPPGTGNTYTFEGDC